MDSQMVKLVTERRRRLVATVMGHAEREFFSQLTPQQQADFRRKTLAAIDDFCDLMRDLLRITGDDAVINEHAISLLEQIHRKVS